MDPFVRRPLLPPHLTPFARCARRSCSWPSTSTARSRSSSISLCEVSYGMRERGAGDVKHFPRLLSCSLPRSPPRRAATSTFSAPHDRRHHCHHLSAPPLRSMRISYIDSPTGSRSLTRRRARSRAHLLGFSPHLVSLFGDRYRAHGKTSPAAAGPNGVVADVVDCGGGGTRTTRSRHRGSLCLRRAGMQFSSH